MVLIEDVRLGSSNPYQNPSDTETIKRLYSDAQENWPVAHCTAINKKRDLVRYCGKCEYV